MPTFGSDSTRVRLRVFVQYLPVYCVLLILGTAWLLFVVFVSAGAVLKEHGEMGRFVVQLVVFHTLLGLSLASFISAVTRRPQAPDQTLAPPDARPLLPDERVDDDDIPLRQLREHHMLQRHAHGEAQPDRELRAAGNDDASAAATLLDKDEHVSLMAKSASGKPRWCRKCNGWKPDRCHHCRSCRQCVLKMDHHCPWLANCVGYHNYKNFMLFVSYTALLAAYGGFEASYEAYRWFAAPLDYDYNDMEDPGLTIHPVIYLVLAIVGSTMAFAIGGLAAYHWYLLLTTLEEMDRTAPSALLADEAAAPNSPAWRPDHLLTRPERVRLRREGKNLNVYDVGVRANFRSVMFGDGVAAPATWGEFARELARAAWPLVPPQHKRHGAGHFFAHDPAKVEELRALTAELRLGVDPESARPAEYIGGGRYEGDESDSESGTGSERTLYELHGAPRRGRYDD